MVLMRTSFQASFFASSLPRAPMASKLNNGGFSGEVMKKYGFQAYSLACVREARHIAWIKIIILVFGSSARIAWCRCGSPGVVPSAWRTA
ncbi:hypothetical protein E3N88_25570 [Mikania micrantha]|uniref:Uncharacterized protein n=1 Tax=Mikania micrantha TaxID=192012 RepID=A0A5N6N613_9ASTR|nr:hypothetical protein E3N88_25570 [Mikania micrantha]